MFTGLCAFPLTPMDETATDDRACLQLIHRLIRANVDSICVLGSTGNYAYLSREERARLVALAAGEAGSIPIMTSIGALRTRDVLNAAEDAQKAGAQALLLAPVSYQKLTEDDVYTLYQTVAEAVSVPVCIYENPATTSFEFSDALLTALAGLPAIGAIKLAGGYPDRESASARIMRLRSAISPRVSLGISGDAFAAPALGNGCDIWFSVIGGLFPETAMRITRLALSGKSDEAIRESQRLEPLWALFRQHGSLRIVAAAAALLNLTQKTSLPLPVKMPGEKICLQVSHVLDSLRLS